MNHMKKLISAIAVIAIAMLSALTFASPASAASGPSAKNQKVDVCHATASETNPYVRVNVSVASFYNAGHLDHEQGGRKDIYAAFSYATKGGNVVNVPAQGDTSLLAFDDCQDPAGGGGLPISVT